MCCLVFELLLICFVLVCSETKAPPNIILIITDDQGNADASFNYQITSPNKKPPINTPNIDYLAKRGIQFARHYSQPMCAPTRIALLTSKYPYRLENTFPTPDPFPHYADLRPFIPTFIDELKHIGYGTHLIGKWGIDNGGRLYNKKVHRWLPSASFNKLKNHGLGPNGRGFDTFYGLYSSLHDHYNKDVSGIPDWHKFDRNLNIQNDSTLNDKTSALDRELTLSSSHIFGRETINLLNEYYKGIRKGPYFIQLSYTMPHDPLIIEDKYLEYESCKNMPSMRRKIYCGMVSCLDESIDNGGNNYVGGFNYPFKGGKGSSFEGGIRTIAFLHAPMLYPNQINKVYPHMFHVTDWGPTILGFIRKISGVNYNNSIFLSDIDGLDFSNSFNNLSKKRNKLIIESNGWLNKTAFFYNEYKFIVGAQSCNGYNVYIEPNSKWVLNTNNLNWANILANIVIEIKKFLFPNNKDIALEEAYWYLCFGGIHDEIHRIAPTVDDDRYHHLGRNFHVNEYRYSLFITIK